jgi:hypothetical protein
MHPLLPDQWTSRALRVAMSVDDWRRLDALARRHEPQAPTTARAFGLAISELLRAVPEPAAEPALIDWMDWEQRKTLRLLFSPRPRAG